MNWLADLKQGEEVVIVPSDSRRGGPYTARVTKRGRKYVTLNKVYERGSLGSDVRADITTSRDIPMTEASTGSGDLIFRSMFDYQKDRHTNKLLNQIRDKLSHYGRARITHEQAIALAVVLEINTEMEE